MVVKKTYKHYDEKQFGIDLICSTYKTRKSSVISVKLKEDLDIDATPSEIEDYLNYREDYEKESNSIAMADIFDRDEYEATKDQDFLSYLRHEG